MFFLLDMTFTKKHRKTNRAYVARRAVRRAPRKKAILNGQVGVYRGPHNTIMPREWYTKLSTTFSGAIAIAGFSGAGLLNTNIVGNSCYLPFANLPAANITWMNGTTPLAFNASQYAVLCNVNMYTRCLVLGTAIELEFNPSVTSANDGIIATITPSTTASGGTPANTQQAVLNPYTKMQEYRATGNKPPSLKFYVDWAKFLGIAKENYRNDNANIYSHPYSAAPSAINYCVINLNTLDCAAPSQPVPFTMKVTHHVKFYAYAASQVQE